MSQTGGLPTERPSNAFKKGFSDEEGSFEEVVSDTGSILN
jgi:hypothetical protein